MLPDQQLALFPHCGLALLRGDGTGLAILPPLPFLQGPKVRALEHPSQLFHHRQPGNAREKRQSHRAKSQQDQRGAGEAEPRLQHPRNDLTDQAPGSLRQRDLERVKAQGLDSARAGEQQAKAGECNEG